MMSPDEQQLLTSLFDRIKTAAAAPRDPEAEYLINDAVSEQPYAPYLLAQAVILQEQALKAADARLHELEAKIANLEKAESATAPSFLGGVTSLFAGGRTASGVPSIGAAPVPSSGVWGRSRPNVQPGFVPQQGFAQPQAYAQPQTMGGFGGGGFLQNAMTTAAGVAGGALLYQGISSLFHGGQPGFGGGYGMETGYSGSQPVINETVNNYGSSPTEPAALPDTFEAGTDQASFDNTDFGGGSDDSGWA